MTRLESEVFGETLMGEGHPVPGERLDTAACLDSTHRGDRAAGCPALSSEAARDTVRWT
ncbi:hypothetical protein LOC72_18340 [Roseiconus lacunae]|nr:hypothetical protein [Roseiconus lacunae]